MQGYIDKIQQLREASELLEGDLEAALEQLEKVDREISRMHLKQFDFCVGMEVYSGQRRFGGMTFSVTSIDDDGENVFAVFNGVLKNLGCVDDVHPVPGQYHEHSV